MCGIIGIVSPRGSPPDWSEDELVRLRDLMAHRGPDGSGLWRLGSLAMGHRRLAVIDPSPAGAQPFVDGRGRGAIVYNGELYNDAELRRELAREGWEFKTAADTETVLAALIHWGERAIPRLRGMYAFAFAELVSGRVLLARDPLGIKPLFWTRWTSRGLGHAAFASEIRPLVRRHGYSPSPDWRTVSAYLTTIRTTLGPRTLYEGIRTLQAGEALWLSPEPAGVDVQQVQPPRSQLPIAPSGVEDVRAAVIDSVRRHLRADVPTCALLSGGLDSSIVCTLARRELPELWTYCSGAGSEGADDDFAFAREVAAAIGSRHAEAPVSHPLFLERWRGMVESLAIPLSTPNEVAINEVARRLRADGKVVTLSGEGADELFGGYDHPMRAAAAFVAGNPNAGTDESGEFQLAEASWVTPRDKPAILSEEAWRRCDGDAELVAFYRATFRECSESAPADTPLQAHLRFTRRVNLTGLLARLDSATMLAGVEGRTPFADSSVAAVAESLPMEQKFRAGTPGPAGTKISLRAAFGPDLPRSVIERAKASFPLPFQRWIADEAHELLESPFAVAAFSAAARHSVSARPGLLWSFAWPMINLGMWGRRF